MKVDKELIAVTSVAILVITVLIALMCMTPDVTYESCAKEGKKMVEIKTTQLMLIPIQAGNSTTYTYIPYTAITKECR